MEGGVRIVSRCTVRPEPTSSRPPEPETIHLTPWDLQLMTMAYIQKGVLLHKPLTGGQHAVERLASSFARALGRFYPLAGRLTVAAGVSDGASPPPSLTILLCCSNEGAEFVHAVAPGVTVADITAPLYIPRVVWSFFPLNGLLGMDAVVESSPILAAQVTELADGIFVAMSLNHGVADGTTFWHFFNTWSEISRRDAAGDQQDREISTPLPALHRWFPDGCPVPIPLPFGKLEDIVKRFEYPPVQECFFHFSAESIKKLKAKANAEMADTATATISSLQALLAHIWRAVCRARMLAPGQETVYGFLVGYRARVKGVPQGYMGNAVAGAVAKSPVGEIMEKGLGWTAWLLNRAVAASLDEASATAMVASWPQKPRFAYIAKFTRGAAGMGSSSSPRFDVYGNDFGWGRPVAVRSGAGNKIDGKVTVYEGRDEGGGSIALEVCLAAEALARLVADQDFIGAA